MSSRRRAQARKKRGEKEQATRRKREAGFGGEPQGEETGVAREVEALLSLGLEKLAIEPEKESIEVRIIADAGSSKRGRVDQHRMFLCPGDMRSLRIVPGDVVRLSFENVQESEPCCISTAWPLDSLKPGTVQLGKPLFQGVAEDLRLRGGSVAKIPAEELRTGCKGVEFEFVSQFETEEAAEDNKHLDLYLRGILQGHFAAVGTVFSLAVNGELRRIRVRRLVGLEGEKNAVVRLTTGTRMSFPKPVVGDEAQARLEVGGLAEQVKQVCQVLELALSPNLVFGDSKLKPPRGVLLFGPPGTGKTLIARTVCKRFQVAMFVLNGAQVASKVVGDAEEKIARVFGDANNSSKGALIFVDEIDALCPSRGVHVEEMYKRIVTMFLRQMDGLDASTRVAVLAATNRPSAIDPALRRPGRFDREIEIPVPNELGRIEILRIHLANMQHGLSELDVSNLAMRMHGFVGADIMSVCREAGWLSLRRWIDTSKESTMSSSQQPCVTFEHINTALGRTKPSALREVAIDVPKVRWRDIGGQDDIKQKLKEAVEWPIKHPDAFLRMGIKPPQGVLLYGPPGCSKTLLAKAIATEGQMNFIAVKGPELFSKWVGESEKAVQEVFRKARTAEPCVIFFDEIDALASVRGGGASHGDGGVSDRVLSQLLTEMDGIEERRRVLVVAATNRPDVLDPALLRPGRLDRVIYVPPPDKLSRQRILEIHLAKVPVAEDVNIEHLAAASEGFSGAEVASICRRAALDTLQKHGMQATAVSHQSLLEAIDATKPQITSAMLAFYHEFQNRRKL